MKHWSVWVVMVSVLAWAGCADTPVETVSPHRGEIKSSFTEPSKTHLEKTYVITMPISGRIVRIDLVPGDKVTQGQTLVAFDRAPLEHELAAARNAVAQLDAEIVVKQDNGLEDSALKEAKACVVATEQAIKSAEEQVDAEKTRYEHAKRELGRTATLEKEGEVSVSELDKYQTQADTAKIEWKKQQFQVAAWQAFLVAIKLGPPAVEKYVARKKLQEDVIEKQLLSARARLARAQYDLGLAKIASPIDGVVLEKHEQGDAYLAAGVRLVSVGNLDDLEVTSNVLTQDALLLSHDSHVVLAPARQLKPLDGKVKRIDPAGFTKLSSLGVEQQRVRVVVSLDEKYPNLGVGYRLQARFFTAEKANALIVPRYSVLQAPDGSYYVFKVVDGKLAKTTVTLGLQSDLELEVTQGLTDKDVIVAAPDATMTDGQRVRTK